MTVEALAKRYRRQRAAGIAALSMSAVVAAAAIVLVGGYLVEARAQVPVSSAKEVVDASRIVFSSTVVWSGIGAMVAMTLALIGAAWRVSSWKTAIERDMASWKDILQKDMAIWRKAIEDDLKVWKAASDRVLDAWKEMFRNDMASWKALFEKDLFHTLETIQSQLASMLERINTCQYNVSEVDTKLQSGLHEMNVSLGTHHDRLADLRREVEVLRERIASKNSNPTA